VDFVRVRRLLRYFAPDGRLLRWPGKFSDQEPCLWMIWSRLPARTELAEPQVNALLKAANGFGDHVLIRRELVNYGMMGRTRDCTRYWRVERQPPADALALIRQLTPRPARPTGQG